MHRAAELVALERRGWDALSTDGTTATEFYAQVLDRDVVMLLPGGLLLTDRAQIVESMGGQSWQTYHLEDPRARCPTADTGVVTYGVVARRAGAAEYSALVSSLYVRRDEGWRMTLHQQTPR